MLVSALALVAGLPPILQPQEYHAFADTRSWQLMPNWVDVLSNTAFILAGLMGLRHAEKAPFPQQASLNLFALGLVLTGLGSAFYHWAPNDQTLVWDRLPMAVAFAGAVGAIAAQHVQVSAALRWQNAWLYLGLFSVALWAVTGDLRLYVITQVGGFLLGLLWMVAGTPSANTVKLPWGWVWVGYAAAKAAESGDAWLWHATNGLLAGHGLKHVLAAAGTIPLWLALSAAGREPAKN